MSVTHQEYAEMLERARVNSEFKPLAPALADALTWPSRSRKVTGKRWNKTEEAFSYILEAEKRANRITEWWYETLTFKLGRDCRYTPDFAAFAFDGYLTLYEVKGPHVREDARVKFRTAATMFPYCAWVWCQLKGGVWTIEPEPRPSTPPPAAGAEVGRAGRAA